MTRPPHAIIQIPPGPWSGGWPFTDSHVSLHNGGGGRLTCADDLHLWPVTSNCRRGLDFSLLFEDTMFSLLPSACFVVLALFQIRSVWRRADVNGGPSLRLTKLITIAALGIVDAILLALASRQDTGIQATRLASAALSVLTTVVLGQVSWLSHAKEARTSLFLNAYLLLALLLATIRTRTAWLVFGHQAYTILFTVRTALLGLVAILEALPKRHWSKIPLGEKSAEETSGLYALAFLSWIVPLIRLGSRTILDTSDLYPLDSRLAAEKLDREFDERWRETSPAVKTKRKSLGLALCRSLFWFLIMPIPSRALMLALEMCQPFFIQSLITYLESKGDKKNSASPASATTSEPGDPLGTGPGLLILASVIIYGGMAVACSSYFYLHQRMLTRARGYLVTAVFRHTTVLPRPDGSVLTLMSTDVQRLEDGLRVAHELWANALEVALAAFLLRRQLGAAASAAPFAVVGLAAGGVGVVSRLTGARMARWVARTEARVKLTSAVVAHVRPVKMAGLAGPVAALLRRFRADELRAGAAFRVLLVFAVGNAFMPQFMAPVAAFASTGRALSTAEVFAALSYLSLITSPLSQFFQRVPSVLASFSSLRRIEDFLNQAPREDYRLFVRNDEASGAGGGGEGGAAISLDNVKVGWAPDKWQLEDLTITIPKSQLTIITGPVASGKSTLCKALLGEASFVQGPIRFYHDHDHDGGGEEEGEERPRPRPPPRIGYCDQTPFLTTGTIRSNIVGFEPFDGALYDEVLDAVLLRPDLAALPRADETEVGSAGVTLSGGQRQRVALARALYLGGPAGRPGRATAAAAVYVLDDVTVGLDARTADAVVGALLGGGPGAFLRRRGATVVWCTHATRFLPLARHVVVLGAGGRVVRQGPPGEVLLEDHEVDRSKNNTTTTTTTHDEEEEEEEQTNGKDEPKRNGSDDEVLLLAEDKPSGETPPPPPPAQKADRDPSRALNGAAVYHHYFSSFGTPLLLGSLASALVFSALLNAGPVWLQYWAGNALAVPGPPARVKTFYLGVYAGIEGLGVVVLTVYIGTVLLGMALASGAVLHRRAVGSLLGAPLRALAATDQGVLVNLFSQDLSLVDTVLPPMVLNTVAMFLWAAGQAVVLALGTPPLALAYPLVAVVLRGVARRYLRASRQLRLLELENKSPLYAQFQDVARGAASLRALGWVGPYERLHHRRLDDAQLPLYLLEACSAWLSLVLKLVAGGLGVGVTVLATTTPRVASSAGLVGAGFVSLMLLGESLNAVVQCFVMLETSLGAVKRLMDFGRDAGAEDRPGEDYRPGEAWPERGAITMRGVDASYQEQRYRDDGGGGGGGGGGDDDDNDATLALRDISLTIRAGEKVGVVGRTGSGKSSLLLLLLRLLDPTTETETQTEAQTETETSGASNPLLAIDGVPLRRVHRDTLRRRLIAVPQDMLFLAAGETFREALDPWWATDATTTTTAAAAAAAAAKANATDNDNQDQDRDHDQDCRSVLEEVGLWRAVQDAGGLDSPLGRDALSHGQKQLFSLAVAVLRARARARARAHTRGGVDGGGDGVGGGGVLLLDEVTSNVDRATELVIMRVVASAFRGYTVLAVTHSPASVAGFDRVVEMAGGRIVREGTPAELMEEGGE